jgi:hypothetical protein
VATTVAQTVRARRYAACLRGPARTAYERWLDDLERRGCAALDYRLAGPEPLPRFCVRHLRAADRAVVMFESRRLAVVLILGRHTGGRGIDVYEQVYGLAGVRPDLGDVRCKDPCREPDGTAPIAGAGVMDALLRRGR